MSTAVVELEVVAPQHRPARPSGGRRTQGDAPSAPSPRLTRPSPAVQLTRRGRLAVFLGSTALVLGLFTVIGGPAASTGDEHHPVTQSVVVAPGQTLWDIAASVAPDEDPRTVIADIVELNGLADAGSIRPGQPLQVPAS